MPVLHEHRHEGLAADPLDLATVPGIDFDPIDVETLVSRAEGDPFDVRREWDPVDLHS
jgi:hypothetical protein